MTDENSLKEFEEMFDLISSNKDDSNTQAEEYGHSMDSEEPFDKLVEEMNDDIKDVSDKGTALEIEKKKEDPHDIIKDIASREMTEDDIISIPVDDDEDIISIPIDEEGDFDTLPEQKIDKKREVEQIEEEICEAHKEICEAHKQMEEEAHIPNEETVKALEDTDDGINISGSFDSVEELSKDLEKDEENNLDEIKIKSSSMIEGDEVKWSLKSPSAMYESFYQQKEVVLNSCLAGGQVEFLLWSKELEQASVDVVTEVFDQQVIIKQMEAVQQFRNRVKYIGVRVNNQYFLFDRFTPLLRGYLARIQYLKPALKQDGLILEHMGDVEMYFERLRGLHKSVADTEKNLAAAYEMLSRKVTICMELPPAERYSKPEEKTYKFQDQPKHHEYEVLEEMEDLDELPTGAKAGPEEKKSGAVGWGNL